MIEFVAGFYPYNMIAIKEITMESSPGGRTFFPQKTFARGAKITKDDPITLNEACFVTCELYKKEHPAANGVDFVRFMARVWEAHTQASAPSDSSEHE